MKNKILALFLTVSLFIGCEKFLTEEPGSQISINELFSTHQGYLDALNGAYYMFNDLMSGERMSVYADVMGGNLTFTPSNTGRNVGQISIPGNIENVYEFHDEAEESDFASVYDEAYEIVNAANIIIERLPELEATTEQKNQIKAEALCIRAYSHYILALLYAQNYSYTSDASHIGIVYNKETLQVGVDYPSRISAKETYNNIINSVQEAIELFSGTNAMDGPDYSYFNKYNAKALLARVALQANNWQLALDNATDVIQNSGISLMSRNEYPNQWKEPNAPVSEILLELPIRLTSDGDVAYSSAKHFGYLSDTEYAQYTASGDLLDLFSENDIRGDSMFIKVYLETLEEEVLVEKPYYFTHKFQDNPGVPVIRLSEMYLISAEANARLNNQAEALADLNVIRERAGLETLTETDYLLEEIFLERRRELCFEGHLFFDIARYHKDVVRNKGCMASVCNLQYAVPYSNYYVLPIPDRNINLNTNLQQNEGY